MNGKLVTLIFIVALSVSSTEAGILGLIGGYGACQTACNAAWVACYTAAGLTAGAASGGVALPAAAIGCNVLQGVCMTSCAAAFLVTPTP